MHQQNPQCARSRLANAVANLMALESFQVMAPDLATDLYIRPRIGHDSINCGLDFKHEFIAQPEFLATQVVRFLETVSVELPVKVQLHRRRARIASNICSRAIG